MTYDECCSGRDWRVHITKRLWLGFGRSICRYISSIHHSQMLSSLLLGSISICQPKKLGTITNAPQKSITGVRQLRFQKFKLHPCFLGVNFQNTHIFQAPLPSPPPVSPAAWILPIQAALGGPATVKGSPAYLSPEGFLGETTWGFVKWPHVLPAFPNMWVLNQK